MKAKELLDRFVDKLDEQLKLVASYAIWEAHPSREAYILHDAINAVREAVKLAYAEAQGKHL